MVQKTQIKAPELDCWIKEKHAEYVRRYYDGKGMLSPSKYLATLLSLHSKESLSLSKIATRSNTTYGTLRLWRTEKKFKEQIENNIEAFSLHIFKKFRNEDFPHKNNFYEEFCYYDFELNKHIAKTWTEKDAKVRFLNVPSPVGRKLIEDSDFTRPLNLITLAIESLRKKKSKKGKTFEKLCILRINIAHELRKFIVSEIRKLKKNDNVSRDDYLDSIDDLDEKIDEYIKEVISGK